MKRACNYFHIEGHDAVVAELSAAIAPCTIRLVDKHVQIYPLEDMRKRNSMEHLEHISVLLHNLPSSPALGSETFALHLVPSNYQGMG